MATTAMMAPRSSIAPEERLRSAALVVVDMQNDFVRAGAPLEVPDARATIPAHQALIGAFRARGRPIVYTRFLSPSEYYLLWEWSPECRPDTKCCWPGHVRAYRDSGPLDCADVIDEIHPEPGDEVVDKSGYGAFHDTGLDAILRVRGVDALVVTGTVTQICVEETAREAFHRGYKTTLAEDAVSSFDPELHAATLRNFAMKFGWVERSDVLVARL